jgi:hypothetical protein
MSLPFSEREFLDILGLYNAALWPAVLISWGLAVAFVLSISRGVDHPRLTMLFVAALWAWSGVAYHAVYFSRINPMAWVFAAMFVVQAVGLSWLVFKPRSITLVPRSTIRETLAAGFLVYAIAYPLLVWMSGVVFPRAPVFALPCPTVLFTAGVLLATNPPVPRWLYVVPVLWSLIGGSAAWLFGVTPDLMMFPAAAAMVLDALTVFRPARARSVA